MMMPYRNVVSGSFDAERFWEPGNLSHLPVMADETAKKITARMDELLFLLCGNEDVLFTKEGFHPAFKKYLTELGFSFDCNEERFSMEDSPLPIPHPERVAGAALNPFALLPNMEDWCRRFAVSYQFPSMPCVKEVNSKGYSYKLRRRLGLDYGAVLVNSAEELLTLGATLLNQHKQGVVVKELYGVSGKGNLLIQSPAILERIARFLDKQERKGCLTQLLLEPFLEKERDFACAAFIGRDQSVRILTVQEMKTIGLAYGGSSKMQSDLYTYIEQSGYFRYIASACEALGRTGYFGDVCFDSMLLQDGSVIPIVEINARKSMTLFKYHLDRRLEVSGLEALFSYAPLLAPPGFSFSHLVKLLEEEKLLFAPGQPEGILPLSANTINQMDQREAANCNRKQRGRIYFAAAARTQERIEAYYSKMQSLLENIKQMAPAEGGRPNE